jgi:hypothetical protein
VLKLAWPVVALLQQLLLWRFVSPDSHWTWIGFLFIFMNGLVQIVMNRVLTIAKWIFAVVAGIILLLHAFAADYTLYKHWQMLLVNNQAFGYFSGLWVLGVHVLFLFFNLFDVHNSNSLRIHSRHSPGRKVLWLFLAIFSPWAIMSENVILLAICTMLIVIQVGIWHGDACPWIPGLRRWIGLVAVSSFCIVLGILTVFAIKNINAAHRSGSKIIEIMQALTINTSVSRFFTPSGILSNSASTVRAFAATPESSPTALFAIKTSPESIIYLCKDTSIYFSEHGWVPERPLEAQKQSNASACDSQMGETVLELEFLGDMLLILPVPEGRSCVHLSKSDANKFLEYDCDSTSSIGGISNLLPEPLLRNSTVRVHRVIVTNDSMNDPLNPAVYSVPLELRQFLFPIIDSLSLSNNRDSLNRLRSYFAEGTWTQDVSFSGQLPQQLEQFLHTRTGWCTQFATAFTLTARLLGFAARHIEGYAVQIDSEQNGTSNMVRAYHAHAWSEVWLPGQGWTRFDPSPSASIRSAFNKESDQKIHNTISNVRIAIVPIIVVLVPFLTLVILIFRYWYGNILIKNYRASKNLCALSRSSMLSLARLYAISVQKGFEEPGLCGFEKWKRRITGALNCSVNSKESKVIEDLTQHLQTLLFMDLTTIGSLNEQIAVGNTHIIVMGEPQRLIGVYAKQVYRLLKKLK